MSVSISIDLRVGMIAISGGSFAREAACSDPEQAPVRRVRVEAFLIDTKLVTKAHVAAYLAV